jgi:hypothetical protein
MIAFAGTIALCIGLPLLCAVLAALYLRRKFKTALSYFLVRSVFSGNNDSAGGFAFKVFCLGRTFSLVFIVISPSWSGDTSQLIGLQSLVTTTLFVEGLTQPRTTTFMNIVESAEEIVLVAFLAMGFSATGLHLCLLDALFCRCLNTAAMVLAVVVNDNPSASTVRHEAGSYAVLALFIAPLLGFSVHHTVHALGIRACIQNRVGAAAVAPDTVTVLGRQSRLHRASEVFFTPLALRENLESPFPSDADSVPSG